METLIPQPHQRSKSPHNRTFPLLPSAKQHFKCRNTNYARVDLARASVPDDLVFWEKRFESYAPPFHTAISVIGKPWADPEYEKQSPPPKTMWNTVDVENKIDRTSHIGPYKLTEHNLPKNPVGRTGIQGRGCLGRWGPNHAADPIVTRWQRNETGEQVTNPHTGKPILQFVAIQRRDTRDWAIPGGMVDPGEMVTTTLRREFGEEAMNCLEMSPAERKRIEKKIDDLFRTGSEVYRGYVDDPRNTDNAWMETVAYNFHDEKGDGFGRFKLHAGDDAMSVMWMDVNKELNLYASHAELIKRVVERLDAHW